VTISTVGYGDRYPVTNEGRVIGAMIIVVGVGIFGTFTGYLANFFLSPRKRKPADEAAEPLDRLRALLAMPGATLSDVDHLLALQRDAPPGGDEQPVS